MKVIIVYDSMDSVPAADGLPGDFGAEYDDRDAVHGIAEALRHGGHSADTLRLDRNFTENIMQAGPDIVFNIAEGVRGRGRESLVPAWLDYLDVPYTGSDAAALCVSLDKALAKRIAGASGIRTPGYRVVERMEELDGLNLEYPLFLKPVAEGSSMGVRRRSLVETGRDLEEMAAWVISHYRQGCLIEEFAPGREYCVGLLGNRDPHPLPIVEVRADGGFYSYEQKSMHRKELICPADMPEETAREMVQMALSIFKTTGCRDLARVDFKLDRDSKPSFLEINPLPGLAERYGIFPAQARADGIGYDELINRIVELAVERGGNT